MMLSTSLRRAKSLWVFARRRNEGAGDAIYGVRPPPRGRLRVIVSRFSLGVHPGRSARGEGDKIPTTIQSLKEAFCGDNDSSPMP